MRVSENVMVIRIFLYVPVRLGIRAVLKYYVMRTSVTVFMNCIVRTIK